MGVEVLCLANKTFDLTFNQRIGSSSDIIQCCFLRQKKSLQFDSLDPGIWMNSTEQLGKPNKMLE